MQKSRSQTDTQPIRMRDARKGSGVTRRPVSLLVDSPDPTALFDRMGRVLLANEAALSEGTPGPGTLDDAPESAPPFWLSPAGRDSLIEATAVPGGARNLEVRIPAGPETGERIFWVRTRIAAESAAGGFLAAAREVTGAIGDLSRAEPGETVAEAADALTGFANREQFHFELEREIARADLFGRPLALLVFGLDNFKTLNDTHGLLAGDEYLRSMAETLRATLLGGEIAGIYGPLSVQGELISSFVERGVGPTNPTFWGAYGQASWFLTGETRPWDRAEAVFGRP